MWVWVGGGKASGWVRSRHIHAADDQIHAEMPLVPVAERMGDWPSPWPLCHEERITSAEKSLPYRFPPPVAKRNIANSPLSPRKSRLSQPRKKSWRSTGGVRGMEKGLLAGCLLTGAWTPSQWGALGLMKGKNLAPLIAILESDKKGERNTLCFEGNATDKNCRYERKRPVSQVRLQDE